MKVKINTFEKMAMTVLFCAAAQAATTNTTLTVNGTVNIGTSITASGTATLTTIGNGNFSATVPASGLTGTTIIAPYTITLQAGNLTGNLTLPASLLTGSPTAATGSATVTGGTGAFAGATGSFPSLTGAGSIGASGITFSFTGAGSITTGGTPGAPTPTITTVADAADYAPNIALGSIFVVKGTNLSASGYNPFGFPLPASSPDGVSITFTPAAGGSGARAFLVYTFNQNGVNQLAAILPSTLAPGVYNVTVTNGGVTSAPVTTTVVKSKVELFTQDSSGSGLAVVQNFISAAQLDVDRFTSGSVSGITISPAKPGQVLIAWATGLGPVSGADNMPAPGFNFAANGSNVQVIVGGRNITPAYAGRAPGLAGADQINFTLPADVPTGCTVPFQISVDGVLSAPTFISIAASGSATECTSLFFTAAQLKNFDQGQTLTTATFSLSQIAETLPSVGNVKIDAASGAFTQYSGFQLAAIPAQLSSIVTGVCTVTQFSGTTGQAAGGQGTNLDAGTVTLNGPSGSNITNMAFTKTNNAYSMNIGEEGLPGGIPGVGNGTIVAGTYTLTGAGGQDVGKFSASLTLGTPLTITGGLPSTVSRSAGLTLNWTGGNPTDIVEIFGSSSVSATSGASFVCTTTARPGTFTVPPAILTQLPASSTGFLSFGSAPNPVTFTAPLTAGGSVTGNFLSLLGIGNSPAYQ